MAVKTKIADDNLVERVQVQGRMVPMRRYWLEDHYEFRIPYKDPATGKRCFICARTPERAREAASRLAEPVLTPEQAQTAAIKAVVNEVIQNALSQLPKPMAPAPVKEITFGDLANQFLACKATQLATGEIRPASHRDLLTRTNHLKKVLGGVSTSALTVDVLDTAVRSLPAKSPRSIWNYGMTLKSVLIWGRDRDLAPANILQVVRAMSARGDSRKDAEEINPFSVEEVEAILKACLEGRIKPRARRIMAVVALEAFCGLRALEACVIDWSSIDLKAGVIRVNGSVAKLGRKRTIAIPENARAWLELVPSYEREGQVCRGHLWDSMQWVQTRVRETLPDFKWRKNGLRSAFISHHLAKCDKITETAKMAGNSPEKIEANYWLLKTKEEAERYFNILPKL